MGGLRPYAIGAVVAVWLALPGAAPAQGRDCFWAAADDPSAVNVAFPDEGANYWGGHVVLPPGSELVLRGRYPHARYMSFNVYDPVGRPTDGLADVRITPDERSANPFEAGASRGASNRGYTVRVVSGAPPPPGQRAPNTIYLNAGGMPFVGGALIYRVYVPDRGRDDTGGAGLPRASLRFSNGQELQGPALCDFLALNLPATVNDSYASSDGLPDLGTARNVHDPLRWEKFFNLFHAGSEEFEGTPLAPARGLAPTDASGGFLSNVDNAYATARTARSLGPVVVLEGRAPTFPSTRDGASTMGTGQVRYWSLCENERRSTRFVDCLIDEDVLVRPDGRFTIVMSTPGQRPANAIPACGVNWLAWGAAPEGLLILRHMLPSLEFAQAIQNVSTPGTIEGVVGEYLPAGRHMSKAAFESRGCSPAPVGAGPGAGTSCMPPRPRVGARAIGRVRLRERRSAVLRRAGKPDRVTRRTLRYCVRGGGSLVVALRRDRAAAIGTTAAVSGARGVRPGTTLRRLRRAYRRTRSAGRGALRSGRLVFGIRRKRVRYVALVDSSLTRKKSLLRGALRDLAL